MALFAPRMRPELCRGRWDDAASGLCSTVWSAALLEPQPQPPTAPGDIMFNTWQGARVASLIVAIATLIVSVPAWAGVSPFVVLDVRQCRAAPVDLKLPPEWHPYLAAVRVCPMARGGAAARVSLVSVFVDEYYRDLPKDAPWQDFPRAMLIDPQGRCLSRLAHLYPVEPPSELVVRSGKWRHGLPTDIRFRVKNPAVSGDYELPTLTWNPLTKTYQPVASTNPQDKDSTKCP